MPAGRRLARGPRGRRCRLRRRRRAARAGADAAEPLARRGPRGYRGASGGLPPRRIDPRHAGLLRATLRTGPVADRIEGRVRRSHRGRLRRVGARRRLRARDVVRPNGGGGAARLRRWERYHTVALAESRGRTVRRVAEGAKRIVGRGVRVRGARPLLGARVGANGGRIPRACGPAGESRGGG